ncbi:hypothetical protein GCM10009133_21980 [Cocleimonas flava]|uniref:PD-(D/E)XK nuclease superfamily protein n=1 Tax=Cocleimonas flava TaxID=634765 RepID=A0A4V2P7Q6_9GAMM|nr:PD-(D/E)XK nuclease family protein [Cocleimonas flava]TCJ82735.1 PD-(D/E)XK nuclease superfamily protein [Cocleimonas flava]
MTKKEHNLLDKASEIGKRHDKLEKDTGYKFNLFTITKIERYEVNTHSAIIAELLNPKGLHGQGVIFLELFMNVMSLPKVDSEITLDYLNVEVVSEESFNSEDGENTNSRIDIIIKFSNYWLLIENKIDAFDGKHQLKKYKTVAESLGKEWDLIYLTKEGSDASDQSGGGVKYTKLSYSDHIIAWLELCIKEVALVPIVREAILQYLNLTRKITGNDMTTVRKSDLVKLLSKDDNLKTAIELSKSINNSKGDILFEFFEDLKEKNADYIYRDRIPEEKLYGNNKCKKWFEQKGISKQNKLEGFGLFIKTRCPDILIHIMAATQNIHYGFLIKTDSELSLEFKKYKESPYELNNWGDFDKGELNFKWYSKNCGSIREDKDVDNLLKLRKEGGLREEILTLIKNF